MWKKRSKKTPKSPTEYPTGTVVHTESGWYYINGKFKHKFLNRRVMESWNFRVVESSDVAISKYFKAKALGFRDGTLIRDISDGKIYLIAGKQRRTLASEEAFERLGLSHKDAQWVSVKEVELHEKGDDIV